MISFIIPIIHPLHKHINNYQDILICLMRTLDNLLNTHVKVTIIVVAHKIPEWFQKKYQMVYFIKIQSKLFNFLKDLDGEKTVQNIGEGEVEGEVEKEREMEVEGEGEKKDIGPRLEIPSKYKTYLSMNGKFHNKDKGLKYFL